MSKKRNNQKQTSNAQTTTEVFANKMWIVSVVLIVAILVITGFYIFSGSNSSDKLTKVCIEDNCYDVEIADSQEERAEGLMYKDNLPTGSGMLFKYNKSQEPEDIGFWMKNTNIPLDLLWISKDKKIVDKKENFKPCIVNNCKIVYPKEKAKYVLEVNSGEIEEKNISVGQKVYFK